MSNEVPSAAPENNDSTAQRLGKLYTEVQRSFVDGALAVRTLQNLEDESPRITTPAQMNDALQRLVSAVGVLRPNPDDHRSANYWHIVRAFLALNKAFGKMAKSQQESLFSIGRREPGTSRPRTVWGPVNGYTVILTQKDEEDGEDNSIDLRFSP